MLAWRDGWLRAPVACRGPRLSSQHPHDAHSPQFQNSWCPDTLFWPPQPRGVGHTSLCRQNAHTHKVKWRQIHCFLMSCVDLNALSPLVQIRFAFNFPFHFSLVILHLELVSFLITSFCVPSAYLKPEEMDSPQQSWWVPAWCSLFWGIKPYLCEKLVDGVGKWDGVAWLPAVFFPMVLWTILIFSMDPFHKMCKN